MESDERKLERIKSNLNPLDFSNEKADLVWLIQQAEKAECYLDSLRDIETHIRAAKEPVPHIIKTLKATLPEFE